MGKQLVHNMLTNQVIDAILKFRVPFLIQLRL